MNRRNTSNIKLIITIIAGIIGMLLLFRMGSVNGNFATGTKSYEPHNIQIKVNTDKKLEVSCEGPENVYILASDDENVRISDDGWTKMEEQKAVFDLTDHKEYYFIKYANKIYEAGSNEDVCYVELSIENGDHAYLAVGEEFDYRISYTVIGYTSQEPEWNISDKSVVSIENGHVTALAAGETTVTAYLLNKSAVRYITVSDLFVKAPEHFNIDKEELPCERYSEEDNDLLDAALKSRIEEAGHSTRAGVVEAARFLTLNFPYKIDYFFEWGRQGLDGVDGEGRYYIEGLYLDESRFDDLIGSNTGPQTWGCPLYSQNVNVTSPNGLDCSGFVTWAIFNGGFDCGDIGAGFESNLTDLTDISELVMNTQNDLSRIKVGDVVHSDHFGGHVGIIIGIKDGIYYVAEATPDDTIMALVVSELDTYAFMRAW
ncbi:MAG: Ig-like domain-containing protein, partial [Erysipelotrichaceae bacterium]|nr:Ig-like domain-containing protein [Erysipelotrichaceae bacterium]